MSTTVVIIENNEQKQRVVDDGATGLTLFGEDRTVVAMRRGDELLDLTTELTDGDQITPVLAASPEGLSIIRHSAAHVTAQALQAIFPEAKLGIGPPITDGFYYDFRVQPLTPEDLKTIEKAMVRIIKERQRFVRRVVSEDEARLEEAGEPYKLELIADKAAKTVLRSRSAPVI